MSRSTDAWAAGRVTGGARRLARAAAAVCLTAAAGRSAAQTPAPGAPAGPAVPAVPAAVDTARARRDSVRAAPSDSAGRDSVIARQLRADARRSEPVYRRFTPDQLRLAAVGAAFGIAAPDQLEAAPLYAVYADYGELAPRLRVLFGVTYWSSEVRAGARDALGRALGGVVRDPAGDDTVRLGRVRSSDIALNADLRWRPPLLARRRVLGFRPWVGVGGGVHLLDVQGAPLTGTFVERSLDGVSFGVAGSAGADLLLLPNVQVTAQARYDLFSGAHFGSVRAGASYVFDRRGRP